MKAEIISIPAPLVLLIVFGAPITVGTPLLLLAGTAAPSAISLLAVQARGCRSVVRLLDRAGGRH